MHAGLITSDDRGTGEVRQARRAAVWRGDQNGRLMARATASMWSTATGSLVGQLRLATTARAGSYGQGSGGRSLGSRHLGTA